MSGKERMNRSNFLRKKRKIFKDKTKFKTEQSALNKIQKRIQECLIDIIKAETPKDLINIEKKLDIYRRIQEEFIVKQILSGYQQTLEKQKETGVIFYPELLDWTHFNAIISNKKEFKDYEYPAQYKTIDEYYEKADKACDTREKSRVLNYHQNFVRNFISPLTPYNGVLLWHGVGTGKTCAGISIAEQFIHVLGPNKKECIVISSGSTISDRWKNEIFNPDKERSKTDKSIQLQCTGDTYTREYLDYMSKKKEDNERIRKRKQNSLISKNYSFFGYGAFAGYVRQLERIAIETRGSRRDITEEYAKINIIKKFFSNRVIIVDEAHNSNPALIDSDDVKSRKTRATKTVGKKEKAFPPALKKVLRYSDNVKLILLTATPMNNSASEIVWLLNLLLMNDKRGTIFQEDFFSKPGKREASLKEDETIRRNFKQLCTGYISYLRGNNPISFPIQLTPDINNTKNNINSKVLKNYSGVREFIKMYYPNPQTELNNEEFIKRDDNEYPKLVYNPMKRWQYKYYIKSMPSGRDDDDDKRDYRERPAGFAIPGRQASVIVFPTNTPDPQEKKWTQGEPGNKGFKKAFKSVHKKWKYRKHCIGFLRKDKIQRYSTKFYNILNNIIYSVGIVFVYLEWIEAGSIPFALMLEQNGYTRFTDPKYNTEPMLDTSNLDDDDVPIPRCWCGKLQNEHDDDTIGHVFSQGKYVHFTGSDSKAELDFIIKQINDAKTNRVGENIKIIIATAVAKEGLSFFGVREIHITSPWHHQNREKQIIGRGTRHCSHWQLDRGERNITIYKHCATVPNILNNEKENYKDPRNNFKKINKDELLILQKSMDIKNLQQTLQTETIDESIYRKSRSKAFYIAKVERFLKKNAIDCLLNKEVNTHKSSPENKVIIYSSQKKKIELILGDQEGSEECDFGECDYTCEPLKELEAEMTLDTSTYQIEFSKNVIEIVKQYIRYLYMLDYDYTLNDIIGFIRDNPRYIQTQFTEPITIFDNAKIENSHIYLALHSMLKNKDIIYDRYDRTGYLIYRNSEGTVDFSGAGLDGGSGAGDAGEGAVASEQLQSHYIFQPMNIDNEAIPMRYRRKLLHMKPQPITLTQEILETNSTKTTEDTKEDIDLDEDDSSELNTDQILQELKQEVLCWFPYSDTPERVLGKYKRVYLLSNIFPWLSYPKNTTKKDLIINRELEKIYELAKQVIYEMLLSRFSHKQHKDLLEILYPKDIVDELRSIFMTMIDSPDNGSSNQIRQVVREWDFDQDDSEAREDTEMIAFRYYIQKGKGASIPLYYKYYPDKSPKLKLANQLQKNQFITSGIDSLPTFRNYKNTDVIGFMKTPKRHTKPTFLIINYLHQTSTKKKKHSDKRVIRRGSECSKALGAKTTNELYKLIKYLIEPTEKSTEEELHLFNRTGEIPRNSNIFNILFEKFVSENRFNFVKYFENRIFKENTECSEDRVYWKKQTKKKERTKSTVKDLCQLIEFLLRFKRKLNPKELWYMTEFERNHYSNLIRLGVLDS